MEVVDSSDMPRDAAAPSRTITQEDLDEYGIEISCPPEAIPAILAAAASVQDIPAENAALARAIANSREYNSEEGQDAGARWGRKKKAVVAGAGVGAVVIVSILGAVVYRIFRGPRGKQEGASRSVKSAGGARESRGGSVRSAGSQGQRGAKSKRSATSAPDAAGAGSEKAPSRNARSSAAGGASAGVGTSRAAQAVKEAAAARSGSRAAARAAQVRGQNQSSSDTASGQGSSKSGPDAAASPNGASSQAKSAASAAAKSSPEALPMPPPKARRLPPSLTGNVARGAKKPDSSSDAIDSAKAASVPASEGMPARQPDKKQPKPEAKAEASGKGGVSVGSASQGAAVAVAAGAQSAAVRARGNDMEPAAAAKPNRGAREPSAVLANDLAAGKDTETAKAVEERKEAKEGFMSGQVFNAKAQEFRPRDDASSSVSPVHFNVNAPEFKPTRSASEANSSKGLDASDGPARLSADEDVTAAAGSAEDAPEQLVDQTDDTLLASGKADKKKGVKATGPSDEVVQRLEALKTKEDAMKNAAEEEDTVQEGEVLQPEEYELAPLELAGADIAEDDEQTPDEVYAKEHLVEVAKSLRSLGDSQASRDDLFETGMAKLQADIDYCKSHKVRPFIFAEHASTAADFLFHIGEFAAAEQMLADAVQAAKMAGNDKLHATLINNLGTALVKQSKNGQALTVHKRNLAEMVSTHDITSTYVVMARHSVIDILTTHKQYAECTALLEDQTEMLRKHYMQTLAEYKQHNPASDGAPAKADGSKEANGDSKGKVSTGDVAVALQALARCHLDHGKQYDALKNRKKAIFQGRKALALYQEAQKYQADTNPVYLSFLASQLKSHAEISKAAGGPDYVKLFKESRQLYRELLETVQALERHRNVPMLHQIVANLSVEIGDTETAVKQMETFVACLQSMYKCKATDPPMVTAWEAKAAVHELCGDSAGAQFCNRQALKCKSNLAKTKDTSHNKGKGKAPR